VTAFIGIKFIDARSAAIVKSIKAFKEQNYETND
jgi:hypothetical protein